MHRKQLDHRLIHVENGTPRCESRNANDDRRTAHIQRARLIRLDLSLSLHAEKPRNSLLEAACKWLGIKLTKDRLLACRRLTDQMERVHQIGLCRRLLQKRTNPDRLALRDEVQILHRTDHQDLRIGIDVQNPPAALQTIRIRQIHIHRHEIRTQLRVKAECLHRIRRHAADLEIRIP